MNKIQKTISAIAAIVLLVSVTLLSFAFKSESNVKNEKISLAPVWYEYIGADFSETEIRKSSNYTRVTGVPTCSSTEDICAVQLEDVGLKPTFLTTSVIANSLWNAQFSSTPTSTIKMKD